jgi:hypothetical protein
MAGINVNQITSTLAGLPDQALQQYAAMHKNDPYVLSLTVSESNRRKALRIAGQGAQGMQPQPKVADAAIAQMAPQPMPEQMGIGALPAQNMQQMADGGIAGYEGYDEGGMAYGQEPVMMMAEGGVARYQAGGRARWEEELERLQAPPPESSALGRGIVNAFTYSSDFAALLQRAKAKQVEGLPLTASEARALQSEEAPTATKKENPSPQDLAQFDAASNLYMTERAAKQAADKPPPPPPPPPPPSAPGPAAPPRPAAPEQSAAARFMAMQKAMDVDGGQGLETAQKDLSAAVLESAESNERELEKEIAARGKAGEGREARLNKREAGKGAQKSELQGLALLETGLAILSTPGTLAEAVGKGAQAGLRTYGAGVKDLRAAQEKLDDARDQLEELRRNEDNMTARERREARQGVKAAQVKGKELGLQAAEKMYGFKRADATAVFSADTQERLTGMEIQGRKEAAQIAAGPSYERNQMLKSAQGDEAKLRTEYGKLQAKVMDTLSKDTNYQMANPAMQNTMYTNALRQAVSTNPFLASYASGIGFSAAPTGKVYDLTED